MPIDEVCEPWDFEASCCTGWIAEDAEPPEDDEELAAFEERLAIQERAVRWATAVLWKRSGRRYGVCTSTVRICPPFCNCDPCRCGPGSALTLSTLPVVAINQITDVCTNTVIDPDRYAIVGDHGVGLIDNTCSWLVGVACELEIEFEVGWEPDIEATEAMSELACEYVKHCLGQPCRSDAFLKLAGNIRYGNRNVILTGLPLVDHFLAQHVRQGTTGMIGLDDAHVYSVT